jgi:hypothetical protein
MKKSRTLFALFFVLFFCFTASVFAAEKTVELVIPGCGA